MWTFHCYDDGSQPNLWARWYHAQSDETRGQHTQVFDALEQLEPAQWREPQIKSLKKGLIEIKVRTEVEWRIFGMYWPKGQRRSFTVLLIGYHKQRIYQPPGAVEQARKRLKQIENGQTTANPCDRPTDPEEI